MLSSIVWKKFSLSIPPSFDISTILHAFQLFEALKYHTGVTFRDSNQYVFHHSSRPEPFRLEDLLDYSSIVKVQQLYPGIDHDLETLSSAYIKERMYGDALNVLRIHMSNFVLQQGTQIIEDFLSPKQRALSSYLTYKIALCHFMLKQYDLCCNVLLAQLESMPKYSILAARTLTLLMSSTFLSNSGSKSSKISSALKYFELARTMYFLTLGSQSPAHGLHISALADLYYANEAFSQAKVTNMIAYSSYRNCLGDMHPVCAGVACKLGNLLLYEEKYAAAAELFEHSFAAYQHVNKQCAITDGSDSRNIHVYYADEAHCLHSLATALKNKNELSYAMQCAVLSVDIATLDGHPMTPGVVHTLLLLAEMYEATSDLFTAVALYQDVWKIVKSNPHVFPMATMLVDIAGRIVRIIVDMLPLQSKTLLDTIIAESEKPSETEWKMTINMLISELWAEEPVGYIRDTIKQSLDDAGETGNCGATTTQWPS